MLMISYCFMVFHFHSKKVSLAISKPKELWNIVVKAMIQDNPDHAVYLYNYTMCIHILKFFIFIFIHICFTLCICPLYITCRGLSWRVQSHLPQSSKLWELLMTSQTLCVRHRCIAESCWKRVLIKVLRQAKGVKKRSRNRRGCIGGRRWCLGLTDERFRYEDAGKNFGHIMK